MLVTLSAFTLVLTGCASITQGTNQVISFSIDPTEAKCSIVGSDGATMGSVTGSFDKVYKFIFYRAIEYCYKAWGNNR